MKPEMPWGGGRILELDTEECWELMGGRETGRVGWGGPEGQTIHPVNHAVGNGAVWLRTTAYSSLAREADESPVAFQVDDIDDVTRAGWSVLVRGTAHLTWPGEAARDLPELEPWVEGLRPVWVQIRPTAVTGRRLLPR
ncbi:pyridoxamine 5'-phosphate oxidase family protein [Nocardioides pantholopis]|uniref:pyridoxamine 5'-phosphate oxidase family protein n=1 Tax=Nocardioides pantholopis TaxID=2483798 RepID=UPI0013DDA0A3|nr:pyridoxamine 5'-phosphate oxidase family protein [Nocardioides pantholopis]